MASFYVYICIDVFTREYISRYDICAVESIKFFFFFGNISLENFSDINNFICKAKMLYQLFDSLKYKESLENEFSVLISCFRSINYVFVILVYEKNEVCTLMLFYQVKRLFILLYVPE